MGGGVYSSFALDTDTGILYSPTGNPGPDFVAAHRPGDNLFTSSVVMLDARTGALRGYHQLVKNDFHDWDLAASPILFTSQSGRQDGRGCWEEWISVRPGPRPQERAFLGRRHEDRER